MMAMAAVPVTVLVFAVVFAVIAHSAAARANEDVDRANGMRVKLASVEEDLASAEAGIRGYLLTARDSYLGQYDDAVGRLHEDLGRLHQLIDPDATLQKLRLTRLDELVEERVQTLREVRRLAGARSPREQERLDTWLLHGETFSRILESLTQQMEDDADDAAVASVRSRDSAYRRSFVVQMVAMPAALLIAMLFLLGFTAGIVRRIGWMRANAERLDAGIATFETDRAKDELGQLSRAWSRTGTHLIELQEELRRLATIDPLTGLANRRGFFSLAEHMLLVAARTRSEVALLFIDTDGLKRVNDELGHAAGDALLIEVADVIRETVRTSDIAGRIGGDEFCVLLVGDPVLDAERVVTRLRDTAASHNAHDGRSFSVSMSIGLTILPAGRSVTLEELIDAADEGMYEDKRDRQDDPTVSA
jgi:diguanylate cyclase (GGDEF)-like protein